MNDKVIGVIGAGVMGTGVAQNFAQNGYTVILIDINEQILKRAKKEIYNNLRFQSLINKGNSIYNADEVMERIQLSTDYALLGNVDYIVENVTENWDIKKKVYMEAAKYCRESCIFMVNTSCISITKTASLVKYPDKVLGTHFMNPVPLKSVIEVIRGFHTSEETIETIRNLLESIGKKCIVVNDFPGFVSNRISHVFMNEAAYVVQDQVAAPYEVDEIFKKCYGHDMGPLETADLIGLDTVVNSLYVLYESYQDSKFRCCPLLKKMVDAEHLGRKSGKGFYEY